MKLDMKTATVRQIQHSFKTVLAWVEAGENVVTRRNRRVAEITRPHVGSRRRPVRPDFMSRLKTVFPAPLPGKSNAELIGEERARW